MHADPESTLTETVVAKVPISSTANVDGGMPGLPGVGGVPVTGVVAVAPVASMRTGTVAGIGYKQRAACAL